MKKIIVSLALLASAVVAGAQNIYDAMLFSENNYYGTARTMALGNAVTALGGDLGTIGINPAGSAVAGYGQFTVTPGLNISSISSYYSPDGNTLMGYGTGPVNSSLRAGLPNIGISLVMDTHKRSGVKSVTFAVVSNQTNSYNSYTNAYGRNTMTSKVAEFAAAAFNIDESVLQNYNSFQNSDVPWDVLTAYQGGMFGTYGNGFDYVGVTEVIGGNGLYHYVPDALAQTSITKKIGSKNDLVINMGMNISDVVFIGFNLGVPSASYNYTESFYEKAVNPDNFLITFRGDDGNDYDTYFRSASYSYKYIADVDGIYAKIGAIVVPVAGLRLGASFQTPTAYTISESWQYTASTSYDNNFYDDKQTSPAGDYSYCLRSPYVASLGAAYTFNGRGFISADYEITDYSVMKFRELHDDYMSEDSFLAANEANRHFAGVSRSLRIGGEMKLTPEFSLRAGIATITTPERHWTNSDNVDVTASDYINNFESYYSRVIELKTPHYYNDRTTSYSIGAGYSSSGSFFADIAARLISYPDSTFSPYYDYMNYDSTGNQTDYKSPKVLNRRNLWNVALTLGWRF